MSRSTWKGFFLKKSIFKDINKKVWSRNASIPFFLLNKKVLIHSGKDFKRVHVDRQKIGYKFGAFVATRTYTKKKVVKLKKKIKK